MRVAAVASILTVLGGMMNRSEQDASHAQVGSNAQGGVTSIVDLVVVSEDSGHCESVLWFDARTLDVVAMESTDDVNSPGRLDVSADLRIVAVMPVNGVQNGHLFDALDGTLLRWRSRRLARLPPAALGGDAEIIEPRSTLILAIGSPPLREANRVAVFRLDRLRGDPAWELLTNGVVVEFVALDARKDRIVAITDQGDAYLLDTATGAVITHVVGLPLPLEPNAIVGLPLDRLAIHSARIDQRRVLLPGRGPGRLLVLDAEAADWSEVAVEGMGQISGLDVNHFAHNQSLVALRDDEAVAIARPDQDFSQLRVLDRVPLRMPDNRYSDWSGPKLSVSWAANGERIVTAGGEGAAEFSVLAVAGCGSTLEVVGNVVACAQDERNWPDGIATLNDELYDVEAIACAEPTPTQFATPTRVRPTDTTAPPSPSATSLPESTATPTARVVASPQLSTLWLPISLVAPCELGRRDVDVIMVVDVSTSMSGAKLMSAKDAVRAFVGELSPQDRVALVAFAEDGWSLVGLTEDRQAIEVAIGSLSVASGTRIDRGLAVARAELQTATGDGRSSAVIVLTDGNPSGGVAEAELEANAIRSLGSNLRFVGLGADVDAEWLRRLAGDDGRVYIAPSPEQLKSIYLEVARTIPCP